MGKLVKSRIYLLGTVYCLLFSVYSLHSEDKGKYTITGDRMEIKERGKIISFTGNVKMNHDRMEILGDRMESYEQEGRVVGNGNVKINSLLENGEKIRITSEDVDYDKNTKFAVIKSSPVLTKYLEGLATSYMVLKATQMEFWEDEKKARSTGNTHITYQGFELFSDDSVYNDSSRKFDLTGKVRIIENAEDYTGRYSAEKAEYFIEEGRAVMDGNVRAEIERKK